MILLVLLAALGVTILRIGQLTWLHFFLGLLLIGPVGLKMASTGYRFMRYYTGSPAYVAQGAAGAVAAPARARGRAQHGRGVRQRCGAAVRGPGRTAIRLC